MRKTQIGRRAVLVLAAMSAAPPITARAASTSWTFNGSASWSLFSNWNNGVPVNGSDVFIRNNDAITRLITYDYGGASIQFNSLTIENSGAGVDLFLQHALTFNSVTETVGDTGTGLWNVTGGTHNVTAAGTLGLAFGSLAGSVGGGGLTAGALNVNGGEIHVGYHGTGTFGQSGGSVTAHFMTMGWQADGTGTYNLNGGTANINSGKGSGLFVGYMGSGTVNVFAGTLNAALEEIGETGTGLFNQTAGVNSDADNLFVGNSGIGTYLLSGSGSLTVNFREIVGSVGSGTFNQSGGNQTVGTTAAPGTIDIGQNGGSIGSYSLSGGSLTVNGTEIVADAGTATFNQTGGTHILSFGSLSGGGTLLIGNTGGGAGTYLLSGSSSLSLRNEFVGVSGNGTFNQSGGTHTVGSVAAPGTVDIGVASSASYVLSDGVLTVNGTEIVGDAGTATFNQTGGEHEVVSTPQATLVVGNTSGGAGTYLLSGSGFLFALGCDVGVSGDGTFNQSGADGALFANTIVVGQKSGGAGTYNLSAGTCMVNQGLFVGANGNGTFNINGGTLNGGTEFIGFPGVGLVNQTDGVNIVPADALLYIGVSGPGTYLLSGTGLLSVSASEIVGRDSSGNGTFSQSGGTHTVGSTMASGSIDIGQNFGSTGNYLLGGGALTVNGEEIVGDGGTGTFNQSGGVHEIGSAAANGSLLIGNFSSGAGTYLLSGSGSLTVNGTEFVGVHGSGTFSQTGGVHTVGSLFIGSSGTLNVQGGTLVVGSVTNSGEFNQTGGSISISGTFTNNSNANFGGGQSWGPASVFVNNAGVATFSTRLNASGFGPIVNVTGGLVQVSTPVTLPSLTVAVGKFSVAAGRANLLRTTQLSIDTTGTVDIDDNDFITDSTPLSTVAAYITSGFNNGNWQGTGLTSTHAATIAADPLNPYKTALGYATASSLGLSTFDGQQVSGTSILVRYTYSGDANLDGKVNALDFNAVATNFGTGPNDFWFQGDFNYDGIVNTLDFTRLASNFNLVLASPPMAASLIPEPICLAILPMLLTRRRRRS